MSDAKDFLMKRDAEMYAKAVGRLLTDETGFAINDLQKGKRYYVMSNLFAGVVERILKDTALE